MYATCTCRLSGPAKNPFPWGRDGQLEPRRRRLWAPATILRQQLLARNFAAPLLNFWKKCDPNVFGVLRRPLRSLFPLRLCRWPLSSLRVGRSRSGSGRAGWPGPAPAGRARHRWRGARPGRARPGGDAFGSGRGHGSGPGRRCARARGTSPGPGPGPGIRAAGPGDHGGRARQKGPERKRAETSVGAREPTVNWRHAKGASAQETQGRGAAEKWTPQGGRAEETKWQKKEKRGEICLM